MDGEKTKTGSRVRTRVAVKRKQPKAEDLKKQPDTLSGIEGTTLHPDTSRPVVDLDVTKASSRTAGGGAASIETIFRSLAKELIKGGIVVADSVSEFTCETGGRFKELLAEAKSEVEKAEGQVRMANKAKSKDSY